MTVSNERIVDSLIWKFLERSGTQGVSFIVSIILARLLLPSNYGLIALTTIFIRLANIFIQSGFSTGLIQRKDIEEDDYSTVFYASIIIAILIVVLFFFLAPIISDFYNATILTNVLRVLSITLIFGSVNSIQYAIISRKMEFKLLFHSSLYAVLISGILGLILAFLDYGVWALVYQQITNSFIITLILWHSVKWRPKLCFSIDRLKILLDFGWKILLTNLIGNLFLNFRSLIIGKYFNTEMLGYYSRGMQFPSVIVDNINGSIQSVMLPTYSSQQENLIKLKETVRRTIKLSSFLVFPMMVGLGIMAKSIVIILLTEKWLFAVPFLQIYCAIYALMPIHTSNIQVISALGRSDTLLKIEVLKKIIDLFVLVLTFPFGILVIAFGEFFSSILSLIVNTYPNNKLIKYSIQEQISDLLPIIIISFLMGLIVFIIEFTTLNLIVKMLLQVLVGIFSYIFLSIIFKVDSFTSVLKVIFRKI